MADFVIKQHDTYPPLELTLSDQHGAINLTEAEANGVKLYMKVGAGLIMGTMKVVNAAAGEVKYEWATEDLKTPGTFKAEVEITWKSGRVQTVPSAGDLEIEVIEDLGP